MPKRSDWTDMDADLKHLIEVDGATFCEAAVALTKKFGVKITRSAALGRSNRKGYKSHHLSNRPQAGTIKVKVPRPPRPPKPQKPARQPAVQIAAAPPAIGPVGTFPPDSASQPTTCRYIAGDPAQPDWRVCGHPVSFGLPYCAAHASKCYDGSVKPNARPFLTHGQPRHGRAA